MSNFKSLFKNQYNKLVDHPSAKPTICNNHLQKDNFSFVSEYEIKSVDISPASSDKTRNENNRYKNELILK
jgi:hypothetical protein